MSTSITLLTPPRRRLLVIFIMMTMACAFTGCDGGAPDELTALRKITADAHASTTRWMIIAAVGSIVSGLVGLVLGSRDREP